MSANPTRILLVDDDHVDCMAFLRHIERQSLPYECQTAGSVAEAKEIRDVEKFDVVILDHNLGDGTGFDLLKHFEQRPVIFLTGSESPEVAVRALKSGAVDYLLKDHDRNYLKLMPVAVERALQQRREREQLRESQELFRHSFSDSPIGKAFIAHGGRFLRVNQALCEMFGHAEAEFLEGALGLIAPQLPAGLETEKLFPKAAGSGANRRVEISCRHKNGQEVWVQMDIAQVHSGGEALTYVAQIQDITGRKRAEEVRARLETQLRQSQKMEALGSLAGGVAHEFNNMLGAIVGYTELAKMDLREEHEATNKLDQVLKASQRAKEIVQQILAFSRRQELKREMINLQRVVSDMIDIIRPTIPSAIEIVADIPNDLPPVFGNTAQLIQALTNLCTNAWHAMESTGGEIQIKERIVKISRDLPGPRLGLPDGVYAALSVTDTGPGMDTDTLDRIFEPFFTTKGPGKGSGLGMAVVHGIMKSHDGAVTVRSELGKGTTVMLYFPVPMASAAEKTKAEKPKLPLGHNERILFVDDESPLVMIGSKILQHLGYQVTGFTSGKDARAAFAQQPNEFDLVITDFTMPGMTGIDLADALIELRPDLPIILTTGYIEESIRDQASLLGFREILLKPLQAQGLAEAVARVLAKK